MNNCGIMIVSVNATSFVKNSSLVAHFSIQFAGNDEPGLMVEGQTFTIG